MARSFLDAGGMSGYQHCQLETKHPGRQARIFAMPQTILLSTNWLLLDRTVTDPSVMARRQQTLSQKISAEALMIVADIEPLS